NKELFDRGLRIHTTLDMRQQRAAEAAVRGGLDDLSRRLAFQGPIGHLEGEARRKFEAAPPRPWVPEPSAGDDEGFDYTPAAGDRDQAYLGMVVQLGSKPMVAIGNARVPLAELDANRVKAWRGERSGSKGKPAHLEVRPGDLLPVRLKNVKTEEGTRREK